MATLTLAQARTLIDAALLAARQAGFKPMGLVVVDAAAPAVASARVDGASALRLAIAQGKAAAAVGMGANSRVPTERAKQLPACFGAVAASARQTFIPQTGAVLRTDAGGRRNALVHADGLRAAARARTMAFMICDAGHAIGWGPGRHGPGDNSFNHFIDPFGIAIEDTAEVEQTDDTGQPGAPADRAWPAGQANGASPHRPARA